jgi:hypothetical protein
MMPVDSSPLNRAPDAGIPASCQANLHRCVGRPCAGGVQRSNHEQSSEATVTVFTALLQPGPYGWPRCQDLLQKLRHRRLAGRLPTGQAGPHQALCERVLTKERTDRAYRRVNSDWHAFGNRVYAAGRNATGTYTEDADSSSVDDDGNGDYRPRRPPSWRSWFPVWPACSPSAGPAGRALHRQGLRVVPPPCISCRCQCFSQSTPDPGQSWLCPPGQVRVDSFLFGPGIRRQPENPGSIPAGSGPTCRQIKQVFRNLPHWPDLIEFGTCNSRPNH